MKRHIRLQDIYNEFRMNQHHPLHQSKVWIYVEGANDVPLYGNLFDKAHVIIKGLYGIVSVREIVESILQKQFTNAIGIVDADFSRLDTGVKIEQNIFYTDCHDAEMMAIAANDIFEKVSFICCQVTKDYAAWRDKLLHSFSFVGVTRKFSLDHKLDLNFEGFAVHKFLIFRNDGQVEFKSNDFVHEINQRSPNKTRSVQLDEIVQVDVTRINLWELCIGHDFINVWMKWLNVITEKNVSVKHLRGLLCAAFNFYVFCMTNLYSALASWAKQHGYPIFNAA